ncbi:MAG: Amino-acid carrier protein AlsT [Chlamydiales bacterium]|nr:Amino-acid carrier protein AlsT [Chlamydiales bacterium]MCH9635324.1 Amino-acid carrier protein AlsT [Chlamydiales bacterium]MCH9703497.1 sodium:alanine symporter family protein [Chlamydiota bacterium]
MVIEFLQKLDAIIWQPLFVFLLGVGVYLTWKLKGLQFRRLPYALKIAFSKHDHTHVGDISHFQALMTALAATIGIGNIAGIATAVTMGGLGALFWLWVTTMIGMSTKYAEALLAVKYRKVDANGEMAGGPMHYIKRGLNWKWLAGAFALFGAIATITTGNLVQSNSIAPVVSSYFHIAPWITGLVLAVMTGLVLIGGIKSIGKVTSLLVPFMALFYIGGSLIILGLHFSIIPEACMTILRSAFSGQAALGGFAGSTVMMAIQMGVSRGVFSNESGLGSAPIAAAAAKTDYPGRQALVSMTGAFLSTIVCTFTGLAIAVTHLLGYIGADGKVVTGSSLTALAFDHGLPYGGFIVALCCIFFGFSTIVGWAYYGEKCAEFLLGIRARLWYRFIFTVAVFMGVMIPIEMIWPIADIANAFMALPNLIALLALSSVVVQESDRFLTIVDNEKKLQVSPG